MSTYREFRDQADTVTAQTLSAKEQLNGGLKVVSNCQNDADVFEFKHQEKLRKLSRKEQREREDRVKNSPFAQLKDLAA